MRNYKMHEVTLRPIEKWFKKALPKPTQKDINVQVGVHMEEFAEMLDAIGHPQYAQIISDLASKYKNSELNLQLSQEQKIEFLDALADQVVTATANAYVQGFDWEGALTEVNRSNFSKFEDGEPVFNEQGKITKGKNYWKPNLEQYVNP